MKYTDLETGKEYEIAYSQELQKQDVELKRKILLTGRIGLFVLTVIGLLFALIVYTSVLSNAMKSLVCGG
jgi:hypothetical protein